MIKPADKIYTIFKIKVTDISIPVKVNIGFVYNWGDGPDVWNPRETQSEHKYSQPGIYILKVKPSSKFAYTYDKQDFTETGVHINDTNTKKMVIALLNIGTGTTSIYRLCQDFINLTETCRTAPEGIRQGMEAFINCSSLIRSFDKLPESLVNVTRMYRSCSKLEKAPKLSSQVKYVESVFEGCASIVEGPDFPDTVIGSCYSIFNGCGKLKYPMRLSKNTNNYKNAFLNCGSLIEMPDIPEGIIGNCNFENTFFNSGITVVKKLPNQIKLLPETFRGCKNLKKITNLPAKLENATYCFYGCSSLEWINIDYSQVPNLSNANSMFSDCSKLKNVITGTPKIRTMKANSMYAKTNLQYVTSTLHTTVGLSNCGGCYDGTDPKYVDGKPGNIYSFPNETGGVGYFVTVKLNIKEDGETFAFKTGICRSWGDGTIPSGQTTELSHTYEKKGKYIIHIQMVNGIVQLGDPDLEEPDPNVKAVEEILNIPIDLTLVNLCKNCGNLKKVCSLKHCVNGNFTSVFENCKSLEEIPELNYGNITNMTKTFAGTNFENIKIKQLSSIKTMSGAFANCKNLRSLDVKMGPNLTNIDSLVSDCELLTRVKLDLSQCTNEINASRIFENAFNLRPDGIEIKCDPTLKMDFSYAFYNNNLLTDYKINFIPTNMIKCFTTDKATAYYLRDNSTQLIKDGLTTESYTNSILNEHKDELNFPQHIQKVYKYWEKFPELETKIIDGFNASYYCYKYCEDIDTFIDYNTGEETFGSLGLIPKTWGGWFDTTKSIIGIQIPNGETIHIKNVSNSWVDYGDPFRSVTKEESNTYSKGGKFFLTFEGDFDIDPRSRKYVTEICNLLPNVETFGKDGFSDYPNLKYCSKVIENINGDYSGYFENCCQLQNTPKIPDNAVNIDRMFTGTKITAPPTIPNSVISMRSSFDECRNLKSDTIIPNSVKDCSFAFRNCSAIKIVIGNWNSGAYTSDFKKNACYRGVNMTGIPEDWK